TDVLSGLVANFFGVTLGVPVGLFLNRMAQRAAASSAEAERRARATGLLAVAREAIVHNVELLREQSQVVAGDHIGIGGVFHTATWDAISAEVMVDVRQAELRRALAEHFGQVAQWANLNEMYLSYCVGTLCSYSSAREMKPFLKNL